MTDYAQRLTEVVRRMDHPNVRPRDAATLIVVDPRSAGPKVLMGRRHERHAFLPGKFVFPGGRVDPADTRLPVAAMLPPEVERKLMVDMKGRITPARARAMGLAALRETYEETGLLIGRPAKTLPATRSPAWRAFLAHGVEPGLPNLAFVCRAITPPKRPRRYDTRFFCIDSKHIARTTRSDNNELQDLHWLTIPEALKLDLPVITQVVLEELAARLDAGPRLRPEAPVPYYYMRNGVFRRELI